MNKLRPFFLTVFLTCLSTLLYAAQIDETDALTKAQTFYQHKVASMLRSAPSFQLAYTCRETTSLLRSANTSNYFYIFNVGNEQGFVIVSGDDAVKTILGYSDEGSFSGENMPENVQNWLNFYKCEIKYVMENGVSARQLSTEENMTINSTGSISPLLGKIKWNQSTPFNNLCPVLPKSKKKTVTGCVATAMAQIMKYHKWPVTGTGSNSYETDSFPKISADFSKTSYDWNNMLDGYGSTSTARQDSAVALLMYHCGVSVNMDYNTADNGGSSAYDTDAGAALIQYFGYDSDIQSYNRENFTDTNWKNIVKSELDSLRPVLYGGSSDAGGHEFVCDGYDSNGLFHINWGWGGFCNGYFELSVLEPYSGISGFNQQQSIITGIKKEDGINNSTYQLGIYNTGLTSSKQTLTNLSDSTALNYGYINSGINTFVGKMGLGLYKDGTLQKVVTSFDIEMPCYWGETDHYFDSIPLSAILSEPGLYQIYGIYQPKDSTSWSQLKGSFSLNNHLNLVISDNNPTTATILMPKDAPALSLTQAIQQTGNVYYNRTANFSITVQNTGTEFFSNLGIRLYSKSDNYMSQFISFRNICIPAGETKTFTFAGNITSRPGTYYAVAVYDSTNSLSLGSFKQIGPVFFGQTEVTIQEEPQAGAPDLSLTKQLTFSENSTIYKNESFSLNATIKNTGAFFDSSILAYYFPASMGLSLGFIGPVYQNIETDGTQDITLTGALDLDPGTYVVALYYDSLGYQTPLGPKDYDRITFTLTERPVALDHEQMADLTIYPNPVKDQLNIKTAETIRSIKILDISGQIILEDKKESNTISVKHLNPGIYVIRMELENGIHTSKFIKR